jgi:DNA-binding GntR family transcriptional regulator
MPVSLSHIYINNAFKGVVGQIDAAKVPIFALIEKKYGQKVVRVETEIGAMAIDPRTAKLLKCTAGMPGLWILRVYRGADGAVIQVSQAMSPADRFTYHLDLQLELGR